MATHYYRSLTARILSLSLVAAIFFLMPGEALALSEVGDFGPNPGNLQMYRYIPADLPPRAPLVVALHGCLQSASDYDDESGWVRLAGRYRFALLLPGQKRVNNRNNCFDWFEPGDTRRGGGEALSIERMIDTMRSIHNIDPDRVYITGLSAGGAMTAVMLAAYPEIFAGGAIVAGLPYGCATNVLEALYCMNPGKNLSPKSWGDQVRRARPGYQSRRPVVSLWHGDADSTVRVSNLTESLKQWTNVHEIDQLPDLEETVAGYPHKVYLDAGGNARVETYLITGMAHGTPVAPGTGERQCGRSGAYLLDRGICSSYYIARFWGLAGTPNPSAGIREERFYTASGIEK